MGSSDDGMNSLFLLIGDILCDSVAVPAADDKATPLDRVRLCMKDRIADDFVRFW